jgi:predicted phosphodiesterase
VKICVISDTHGKHRQLKLPEADVLIHCGDSTMMGRANESLDFYTWFVEQPFDYKCLIGGNHDFNWERDYRSSLDKRYSISIDGNPKYQYLMDYEIEIEGVKIYGSPWTPKFGNWAFMLPRGEPIKSKWDLIPDDVEILVTHGPAKGILDSPYNGDEHVGCEELLDKVLKIKPKYHLSGHIHGSAGIKEFNGTTFINASSCDEQYKIANEPIIIEI